jgi:hypothetical protein
VIQIKWLNTSGKFILRAERIPTSRIVQTPKKWVSLHFARIQNDFKKAIKLQLLGVLFYPESKAVKKTEQSAKLISNLSNRYNGFRVTK